MKIIKFLIIICIFFLSNISKSFSLIEVDITRGNLNPLPIAVSPLSQDNKSKKIRPQTLLDKKRSTEQKTGQEKASNLLEKTS